jgi:hypothetical protein
MTFTQGFAACMLLLGATGACQAQVQSAAKAPPSAPAVAASAARPADASIQHTVIEDEGTRIEETRQRGAARRIVVRSKVPGVRDYEIQVAPGGRDPAQERGGAGQRAWSLFSF